MKILLVKGNGFVSKLIQWQTRSEYSHAALLLDSGVVYEAKEFIGVRKLPSFDDFEAGQKSGTVIEVYTYPMYLEEAVEEFLEAQVGKPYDYRSVVRFVSRRAAEENGRWFCSEIVSAATAVGARPLLRGEHHNMSPRDLSISQALGQNPSEIILVGGL